MRNIELTDEYKDKCKEINAKNGYGLNDTQLKNLIKKHKNGSEYDKALIEYRLTDINFHHEVSLLYLGEYNELNRLFQN